ncbi:ATP cone domain-containing protein [Clostridium fallax]|uniref:ATP cone domain-containing protein n=1 Tax=Clostridium fallax TaxID=1533 RepID=A0A1M4UPA5_9CLOT|nr:ATP cone domain-containing protein [Clostridium fallax]SHE58524.1 ATP cone domain-containing protein [Clostridium fallax]SQB07670.1 anaerobic ribonucleoside-triphosphate reductase [Clostridium fallax]
MKVIKRNGRTEEFNFDKLKTSIYSASLEAEIPMTESDLKIVCNNVLKIIETIRKDNTSSYEIFSVTINTLIENNFSKVSNSYFSFLLK